MSLDPSATPKDYSLIIYNKTEVDTKFTEEAIRVDTELATKSLKADEGSPSGIATLDPNGKHSLVEIPIAGYTDIDDITNDSTLITPRGLDYGIQARNLVTQPDADAKYGDVRSDGSIPMSPSYVPQNGVDIATVGFVQSYVSSGTTTYVKDTLAEMLAINPIVVGDVCYVTVDGANNGEYIAKNAVVGGSAITDWDKIANTVAWGAIVGTLADQTDLDTRFTTVETTADASKLITDQITVTQPVDLDTIEALAYDTSRAVNIDVSMTGNDLNTFTLRGQYLVGGTNLPSGETSGKLTVLKANDTSIRQILEGDTGINYERQTTDGGTTWSIWLEKPISTRITNLETTSGINTNDIQTLKDGLNMTPKLGVDIDTIISYGYYEVDTNLPNSATLGELRVGYDVSNTNRVIQEFRDGNDAYVARRQSIDGGTTWSAWTPDNQTLHNIYQADITASYYFNKVSGISTTSSVYTQLNRLTVLAPPSGVYEYKFSMMWNYNTTTKSAYFRFSTDGGVTWNEVRKEAKNVTDNYPDYYAFPVQFNQTGTDDMDLVVEYRTEVDGDVLNVSYSDIVIDRKQ